MSSFLRVFYNCERCPGYCCSYPNIPVTRADLRRFARKFGISIETAEKKFTKWGAESGVRVLRHRGDEIYGTVCHLLDPENRRCTVYESRPKMCRGYPGSRRCGYYDFLCFERHLQEDPDFAATAYNP